jgi:hypothetical protein
LILNRFIFFFSSRQGLGSLQLAQMGSLIQGQQYALLPSSEDAVYVNQKQYHRILKRRQARMKLEARFKVIPRKVPSPPISPRLFFICSYFFIFICFSPVNVIGLTRVVAVGWNRSGCTTRGTSTPRTACAVQAAAS